MRMITLESLIEALTLTPAFLPDPLVIRHVLGALKALPCNWRPFPWPHVPGSEETHTTTLAVGLGPAWIQRPSASTAHSGPGTWQPKSMATWAGPAGSGGGGNSKTLCHHTLGMCPAKKGKDQARAWAHASNQLPGNSDAAGGETEEDIATKANRNVRVATLKTVEREESRRAFQHTWSGEHTGGHPRQMGRNSFFKRLEKRYKGREHEN